METNITSRLADSSHLMSLINLGRTHYAAGHPALSEEFLKWFLLDNPAGPATLIVAHESNLWIGIIVLIPVILENANQSQKAYFAVNVLTHPEHRQKNLFVKMIRYIRTFLANDGVWLLGHPNANALPGWKRQKMQFRAPLHLYAAKFKLPFSRIEVTRIRSLVDLEAIPVRFWNELETRPDVHLKYTPDFLAWRFLAAPHRQYVVSAIEESGELLGLSVTRRFRWQVDLMVDFIGTAEKVGRVLRSVRRPTLVMHPGVGHVASALNWGCWKLPINRRLPFFVSTWQVEEGAVDMTGITLAASDF